MGNVPWEGMGCDRHKLLWDGNGTDKDVPWTTLGLSVGMSFLWESHGKRPMGWNGTGINCFGMAMGQINQVFFKENGRNPDWICGDPISL